MANLEPMPISSLPELDKLQDGDEAVIYRPSTGKAYQAPDLLQDLEEKIQENTDLIDSSCVPIIDFPDGTGTDVLAYFQENWGNLPSGVGLGNLKLSQQHGVFLYKQGANNGAAIVISYANASNPPWLIRVSSGTWYSYRFTVTTA